MTQAELDALKALADAATPGPWLTNGWYDGIRYSILFSANERFTETLAYNLNREDAAFIAATRAAVPALIAEVERLRADNAQLQQQRHALRAELALCDRYNEYVRVTQAQRLAEVLPFDEWERGDVPPLRPDAPRLRRPTKD